MNRGFFQEVRPAACVEEHEVELTVDGRLRAVLPCLGDSLAEMVYGYLYRERTIQRVEDVVAFDVGPRPCCISVGLLSEHGARRLARRCRPLLGAGGGIAHPASARVSPEAIVVEKRAFSQEEVSCGIRRLKRIDASRSHAKGLCQCGVAFQGEVVLRYEDACPLPAFDKLCGACLLKNRSISGGAVLTTGPICRSMVEAAARLGADLVGSCGAPTRQAVEAARRLGIVLAGNVDDVSMRVFSGEDRVVRKGRSLSDGEVAALFYSV